MPVKFSFEHPMYIYSILLNLIVFLKLSEIIILPHWHPVGLEIRVHHVRESSWEEKYLIVLLLMFLCHILAYFAVLTQLEYLLYEHILLPQPGMSMLVTAKIGFHEPTRMGACHLYVVTVYSKLTYVMFPLHYFVLNFLF